VQSESERGAGPQSLGRVCALERKLYPILLPGTGGIGSSAHAPLSPASIESHFHFVVSIGIICGSQPCQLWLSNAIEAMVQASILLHKLCSHALYLNLSFGRELSFNVRILDRFGASCRELQNDIKLAELGLSVPLAHLGGPAKCNWARLTCTKPPEASRSSLGRLLEDTSSSLEGPESTTPISLRRVPKRDVQIAWRPWESIKGCMSDGTLLCFFHTTSSMLAEPSLPRPGTHPYLLLDLRPL
jgi:hypothetical protein